MRHFALTLLATLLGLAPASAAPLPRDKVQAMVQKLRTGRAPRFLPGLSAHGTVRLATGEHVIVERGMSGGIGGRDKAEWRVHGVDAGDGSITLLNAKQRRQIKALLEPRLGGEPLIISKAPVGAVKQQLQAMKDEQRLQAMTPNERTIEALKQWAPPRPEAPARRREVRQDEPGLRWRDRFATGR